LLIKSLRNLLIMELFEYLSSIDRINVALSKVEIPTTENELLDCFYENLNLRTHNSPSVISKQGKWSFFQEIEEFLEIHSIQWLDMIYYDQNGNKYNQNFFSLFSSNDQIFKKREDVFKLFLKLKKIYPNSNFDYFNSILISLNSNENEPLKNLIIDYNEDPEFPSSERYQIIKANSALNGFLKRRVTEFEKKFDWNFKNYDCENRIRTFWEEIVKKDDFDLGNSESRINMSFIENSIINLLMHKTEKEWVYFYMIPVYSPKKMQIGRLTFASEIFLKEFEISLLRQLCSTVLFPFVQSYQYIKSLNSIKKAQIKSAVAAIMSRNMSHNLGSHVLSNLKGELEDIANVFKKSHDSKCLGFKSENLYGLKWFMNYLQERQDFIATIGGFENQTFMPVSFKSFVFDGLLPDHQFARHHFQRDNNNEENNETALNAHKNYLLEYIIKSENVNRDQIVVKYRKFISSVPHDVQVDDDYKKLGRIMVSFPGGIVGRQAFFSIFENILRNAAKHNTIDGDLELTIDTPEDLDFDTSEFIKFTITDNLKSFSKAYPKVQDAINEPIFNESQEKQGNKGIKEMKISAAWLRGISLEDIDSHKEIIDSKILKIPKILDVVKSGESLQYVFYLLKPKELLLFLSTDEKAKLIAGLNVELLEQNGINIISPEYFNHKKNYNLRHSLFVIQSDLEVSEKENIERYFNQRKLFIKIKKLRNITKNIKNSNGEPDKIIAAFWREYLVKDENALPIIYIRPKEINRQEEILPKCFNVKLNSEENYINDDIKLLFNHHNDTESQNIQFRKDHPTFFEGLDFLEGISGGNSTDLLLCRTEKTKLFYYKLFQSCVTDIIIVDERLWNNNSKTDINLLSKTLDENTILIHKDGLDRINEIEEKQEWAEKLLELLHFNDAKLLQKLKNRYEKRNEETFLNILEIITEKQIVKEDIEACRAKNDYKYWLYKRKNIEVVNILFSNNGFGLYNINLEKVGEYPFAGEFDIDNLHKKLNNYPNKIISIHQGIIDKIQNKLNEQDTTNNINAIRILNQAIPNDFIKIIHSGRGKPSVKIPEGFYYVPYASLESAFYDCKFSILYIIKYKLLF